MQNLSQNYHVASMLKLVCFFFVILQLKYLRKGRRNDIKPLSHFDKEVATFTSQQETMKKKMSRILK